MNTVEHTYNKGAENHKSRGDLDLLSLMSSRLLLLRPLLADLERLRLLLDLE